MPLPRLPNGLLRIHSDGYTKGDKYFLFIKGDKYLKGDKYSRVDALQKDHISHTKQCQTFYRKIKCDLLNFRGVQNEYHQHFQYLIASIHIFHEAATLM